MSLSVGSVHWFGGGLMLLKRNNERLKSLKSCTFDFVASEFEERIRGEGVKSILLNRINSNLVLREKEQILITIVP